MNYLWLLGHVQLVFFQDRIRVAIPIDKIFGSAAEDKLVYQLSVDEGNRRREGDNS